MGIFLTEEQKATFRDFKKRARQPFVNFLHYGQEEVADLQAKNYFSQYGQDNFLSSLPVLDKDKGFFVDAGCNHPKQINNTLYFENKGWQGLAIDALPIGDLWSVRTAEFIQCALGDANGTALIDVPSDASGLQHDHLVRRDMFSQVRDATEAPSFSDRDTASTVVVPKKTLKSIFAERSITHIDLMSLDVEGYEMNVVRGIDFNAVSINVISIENNRPYPHGDPAIRTVLKEAGYKRIARIHPVDDVFVRRDLLSFFDRYKVRLKTDYKPTGLRGKL